MTLLTILLSYLPTFQELRMCKVGFVFKLKGNFQKPIDLFPLRDLRDFKIQTWQNLSKYAKENPGFHQNYK